MHVYFFENIKTQKKSIHKPKYVTTFLHKKVSCGATSQWLKDTRKSPPPTLVRRSHNTSAQQRRYRAVEANQTLRALQDCETYVVAQVRQHVDVSLAFQNFFISYFLPNEVNNLDGTFNADEEISLQELSEHLDAPRSP